MAEVLLYHHALGQTAGFHAFADELRRAGHTVHTPDLYDGRTFATLDEGMAYAKQISFPYAIIERWPLHNEHGSAESHGGGRPHRGGGLVIAGARRRRDRHDRRKRSRSGPAVARSR